LLFAEFFEKNNVGDIHAAAGFEDAVGFGEDLGFIGCEVDDAVADDHVDGGRVYREVVDVAEAEFDVGESEVCGVRACLFDHRFGHVDADDGAGRSDFLGGEEAVEAGAGSEVEDGFSGFQGAERGGVAAAEAEVGF